MKFSLLILIIIFPLVGFSQIQKKIKVINGITHKPIKGVYCYILQDNDKWLDIGETNKRGIYKAKILNLDSTATYQIDISTDAYLPFFLIVFLLLKVKI